VVLRQRESNGSFMDGSMFQVRIFWSGRGVDMGNDILDAANQ